MSEESATSPEPSSNPPAEGAPRVRRISNPRIKRPTKPTAVPEVVADAPASSERPPSFEPPTPSEPQVASKFPDFSEPAGEAAHRGDWPEPDAESAGASHSQENQKRKRRRKKGKGGNNPQNAASGEVETTISLAPAEAQDSAAPQGQAPRPPQAQRQRLDSELLAKFAWKIYLSEISEEGVALVGDNDAKELSRRCFRLAEIFMEEQARRR